MTRDGLCCNFYISLIIMDDTKCALCTNALFTIHLWLAPHKCSDAPQYNWCLSSLHWPPCVHMWTRHQAGQLPSYCKCPLVCHPANASPVSAQSHTQCLLSLRISGLAPEADRDRSRCCPGLWSLVQMWDYKWCMGKFELKKQGIMPF